MRDADALQLRTPCPTHTPQLKSTPDHGSLNFGLDHAVLRSLRLASEHCPTLLTTWCSSACVLQFCGARDHARMTAQTANAFPPQKKKNIIVVITINHHHR